MGFSRQGYWSELPCPPPGDLPYLGIELDSLQFSSVTQVCPTLCDPMKHVRPPCPLLTPGVYPNLCPLSQWCHLTISSSVVPLLLLPSMFPNIRVFSNESALHIRWPKCWSFSFNMSPSNEHPGLISFRMDSLRLLHWQAGSLPLAPPGKPWSLCMAWVKD